MKNRPESEEEKKQRRLAWMLVIVLLSAMAITICASPFWSMLQ